MRAFRIAYDGRPFHGFQRQPDVATVEDAIFDALRDLDVFDGEKPDGYAAAGRTDAGVSALAQTVAFEAPEWCSPAALNSELPAVVRAWASADVPSDFHATVDARERTYTYHLYAPGTAAESTVDDERVREAMTRLSGDHDFHNLTSDVDNTVRDLETDVERDGDFLVLTFRAGGFCRQLVRRLVTLVESVAARRDDFDRIERVLSEEPLDGPDGVGPAPPYPLVLTDVAYDCEFVVDEAAATSARNVFSERHETAVNAARVAGAIRDGL
ncbi:tRNA pseudouridine(38-40) synthase TruA [Haloarculaceae archaeon H-GB1-1]|nr:tRNA pseudouridine(38-40) synthase TruA [Haloarculaceae archaeon H-GB1-1]